MTYQLAIGDRTHSSWSLRGWLLFEKFSIPVATLLAQMYSDKFSETLAEFYPAKLVPALKLEDGSVVWDTLAIAEFLADAHPDAGHWPKDPKARAAARSMVAEMHSGFGDLRAACSMNLRHAWHGFEVSEGVHADLARINELWAYAKSFELEGDWLFGEYSVADVFFAPVAARIGGYGLPLSEFGLKYVSRHLSDPTFRRWRAMGIAENHHQSFYDLDLEKLDWPGAGSVTATAVEDTNSVNEVCPYSGDPVTHFMQIGENVYGFCKAFCRDKTIADPFAWPQFMAIYEN
jgi:glutathione S-transferase